jgi:hypothetical protein
MRSPSIPKPALWLGLAGLIPFILPALILWFQIPGYSGPALQLLFAYSAVILSFLGGVHWGRALAGDHFLANWTRPGWSVLPSIIGWGLLTLPDVKWIITGFSTAFVMAYLVDMKAVKMGDFPEWYGSLRKLLTVSVLVAFIIVLSSGFTLRHI